MKRGKKTAPNAGDVCFVTILRSTSGLSTDQYVRGCNLCVACITGHARACRQIDEEYS